MCTSEAIYRYVFCKDMVPASKSANNDCQYYGFTFRKYYKYFDFLFLLQSLLGTVPTFQQVSIFITLIAHTLYFLWNIKFIQPICYFNVENISKYTLNDNCHWKSTILRVQLQIGLSAVCSFIIKWWNENDWTDY